MTTEANDSFVRESVTIVFLWLIAMLVGSLLLLYFGEAIQNFFA
ncbi:MAG: hypothetical protein ABEJ85_00405 [Haloarculaceae archaeon]